MINLTLRTATTLLVACAFVVGQPNDDPKFGEPKMLKAGDKNLGEGRLYPSPVFHDVDGDGLEDLVIGDLIGKVTWARQIGGDELKFGPEQPMLAANKKPLKFDNW